MDNVTISSDKRNEGNNNAALLKRLSSKKPSEMETMNNRNNNDYNDYENQRKGGKFRDNNQSQRERDEYHNNQNIHRSNTYSVNTNYDRDGSRNRIYQSRNDNVVNSILLLLKEVNENDLNHIREEIDKKLSYY